MEIADDVTLSVVPDEKEGNQSIIVVDGRPTEACVVGSVLEAAIRCDPGWLVFLTDDTPFEEMLRVGLVGPSGRLLDSATIGGPYATGTFEALRLEPPDVVHFRFIDDADWWIRVLPRPRLALPFLSDARGAWRGARLTHHFVIDRQPRRWARRG